MAEKPVRLKSRVYLLYHGASRQAKLFRYALLTFDVITVLFFVVSSFVPHETWFYAADFTIAAVLVTDFAARLWIARERLRHLIEFATIADIIVIATLLLPAFIDNYAFLRIARALRLLRSYHVLRELRRDFVFFRRHEEIIQAVVNLIVFIFVVTAVVYVLQADDNPRIANYVDALYYTVSTLTTTGFGDITLTGSTGRLLSVVIMVVGVALFLRLIQAIFRPAKVRYKCPDCGLSRHDTDAVHCKHCGRVIDIATEGAT